MAHQSQWCPVIVNVARSSELSTKAPFVVPTSTETTMTTPCDDATYCRIFVPEGPIADDHHGRLQVGAARQGAAPYGPEPDRAAKRPSPERKGPQRLDDPETGYQLRALSTILPALIQGIMPRSFSPTCSI